MKVPTIKSLGRPRAFDPDQALDRALRVFWRKGYDGASLPDLTEAMGINRPSLYAAFGNKEALFRKALNRYSEGPAAYVKEALTAPTARLAVEQLLHGAVELQTNRHTPAGCLMVQCALSCKDASEPIREAVAARRKAMETALRERFKRAIVEGDLPADAKAADLARYVVTLITGMAVQAASGASRAELRRMVDIALQAWPKA